MTRIISAVTESMKKGTNVIAIMKRATNAAATETTRRDTTAVAVTSTSSLLSPITPAA
jgi:hypothetical protein